MNIDETLAQTFADNEHLAPDASDVLRDIRAELDRGRRRSFAELAPILVAAVIIAVALTVLVTRSPAHHASRPADSGLPAPTSTTNPESVAEATARATLDGVPLPPGAQATNDAPAILGQGGGLELSSLEAKASGVWLVPGTVPAIVAFARAHPASGFTPNCTCGGRTVKWLDFYNRGQTAAISYTIAPYGTGVAIQITVIVPWVPLRPAWSIVADTATSVDVTVKRIRQIGSTGGAPTVHRTLTAAGARRLANVANLLRPQAESLCVGPVITIAATDTLVFHEPHRTVTFTMGSTNCRQFTVVVNGQKPTYLEVGGLDATLLQELGLPIDYGR